MTTSLVCPDLGHEFIPVNTLQGMLAGKVDIADSTGENRFHRSGKFLRPVEKNDIITFYPVVLSNVNCCMKQDSLTEFICFMLQFDGTYLPFRLSEVIAVYFI